MNTTKLGYFNTGDKISKITEDGLRINAYPSGIVTNQMPGESHKAYKTSLGANFSKMTQNEMTDYTFSLLTKK